MTYKQLPAIRFTWRDGLPLPVTAQLNNAVNIPAFTLSQVYSKRLVPLTQHGKQYHNGNYSLNHITPQWGGCCDLCCQQQSPSSLHAAWAASAELAAAAHLCWHVSGCPDVTEGVGTQVNLPCSSDTSMCQMS